MILWTRERSGFKNAGANVFAASFSCRFAGKRKFRRPIIYIIGEFIVRPPNENSYLSLFAKIFLRFEGKGRGEVSSSTTALDKFRILRLAANILRAAPRRIHAALF